MDKNKGFTKSRYNSRSITDFEFKKIKIKSTTIFGN